MKHDKPYDKSVWRSLTMITQFGINMLVPIGLMTALGIFLDQKFETGWITIVLFFVLLSGASSLASYSYYYY